MILSRIGRYLVVALSACLLSVSAAVAQQDVERKTVAITYPLDETVNVKFRGTTVLPRLKGEAKVKRAGPVGHGSNSMSRICHARLSSAESTRLTFFGPSRPREMSTTWEKSSAVEARLLIRSWTSPRHCKRSR